MKLRIRHIRAITRRFWGIVFSVIIAFAVLVQIGRQAFPLMNDYRHLIAEGLSEQLGVVVNIGSIDAQWRGLRPSIVLNELDITSTTGETVFTVSSAKAELSLLDSFVQKGLAWRTITFDKLASEFVQRKDNSWHIRGYTGGTANKDNPFAFDDPLDIFLFGRRVNITSASLTFHFYNGKRSEIAIPEISLDNDRFFHRMTAALNIENEERLRVIVEGYGDPRDREQFSAAGYVRLHDLSTSDVYSALVPREKIQTSNVLLGAENTLNLELWFKGSIQSGMTAKGHVDVNGLPAEITDIIDLPKDLTSNFSAAWHNDGSWFVNVLDMQFDWGGRRMPFDSLAFYGDGAEAGMRIVELDVTQWAELALDSIKDQQSFIYRLTAALQPRGKMKNIDVRLTSPEEGYVLLRSYVEDGAVGAFRGSPEFNNVQAYVEASAFQGFADVSVENDFSVHIKKAYDQPFVLDNVDGQMIWRIDTESNLAYLNSSVINARLDNSPLVASLAMTLPMAKDVGSTMMTLAAHSPNTDVLKQSELVPNTVPASLKEWLDTSLDNGQAQNLDFLYHGAVDGQDVSSASYQFATEIEMDRFQFDKKWPAIEALKGYVMIDSDNVSAEIDRGVVNANRLVSGSLFMPRNEDDDVRIINVELGLQGDLSDAKRTLLDSPLKSTFAPIIQTWKLNGQYSATATLGIPLDGNEDALTYDVSVGANAVDIFMEEEGLHYTNIKGDFHYSDTTLLHSELFTAFLWGEEFKAKFSSDATEQIIGLDYIGEVNTKGLKNWLNSPELVFLSGNFQAQGNLYLPLSERSAIPYPKLIIRSDMQGATIDLPVPLAKETAQRRPTVLEIEFDQNMTRYTAQIANLVRAKIIQTPSALGISVALDVAQDVAQKTDTANVLMPDKSQPFSEPLPDIDLGSLRVNGMLGTADYDDWLLAIERYQNETERLQAIALENNAVAPASQPLFVESSLVIEQFQFGELDFEMLNVAVTGWDAGWLVRAYNPIIDGYVYLPESISERMQIHIDYLSLFEEDEDAPPIPEFEVTSALLDVDLSSFEPADIYIDEVKLAKEPWGSWRFKLEPIENGLHFTEMQGQIRDLLIGATSPADFYWTVNEGVHTSRFDGEVITSDVGNALVAWDLERVLVSSSAQFDVDVSWLAPPDMISLLGLNGDIAFDMRSGSFIRGAEAGENPFLRLIALFNFDTLARRLRLDFSDLAAKGFAYDKVKANMRFENGMVVFADPLIVESTSSNMQLAGAIDLVEESIDSQLVVTLPVAGNLAVATAFVAGLPAGLGVYVVSKMFNKQINKASSINYSVTGPWDDPKLKVKKIFDDSGARKKGKTFKSKTSEEQP